MELQEHPMEGTALAILKKEHDYFSQLSKPRDTLEDSFGNVKLEHSNSSQELADMYLSANTQDSESIDDTYHDVNVETESDYGSGSEEVMKIEAPEVVIENIQGAVEDSFDDADSFFETASCTEDVNNLIPDTDSGLFQCSKCSYSTKVKYYLKNHILNIHHQKPVTCKVCDKVFVNLRYFKRHQQIHKESSSYTCEICGKVYKCMKTFKVHRKTHSTDFKKELFKCDECEKTFASKANLETHRKSEHRGMKKPFLCQTCGKSFTSKHTMLQHLNVHTGNRPYVCHTCGKDFTYESALRDHKNTHEKTRLFVCNFPSCNKIFYQRSALKIHKAIHKESKDFVCTQCGRGFTQKQALQRHERSHKGLKPYRCIYCSRTFGDPSVIRRHIQLVHKVNKDADKWREDVIELTEDEMKAEVEAAKRQAGEAMLKPELAQEIPTNVQGIPSIRANTDVVDQPQAETCGTESQLSGATIQSILLKNPTNKFSVGGVAAPGTTLQYPYSLPTLETAFLIRPAIIQFTKPEETSAIPYTRSDPDPAMNQTQEPVQFLNENLDGTFTSVADSSQKVKPFDSFLRQNVTLDADVTTDQSLEQLKPDGTLAESNIALSDDSVARFGESELTTESLNQFYSYYNSLTNQLTSQDTSPIKP